MVGEKFVMHEHIDGPFLFTNTRAMFSDFKILWALMYTYRNQQKKMFHFQRLGHIARTMKQLRKTELACIEDQSVETLSEMMELARQAKQYILLNEQCMDKLFEMKLFLPFATAAEAALAGMYSCCDPLLYELSKVKQVAQESSQPVSKQIEHSHPKKRAKPDSPSIIGPNGSGICSL